MSAEMTASRKQEIRPADESPVYAFLEKPSLIDYPGSLCAVFFTSGCNFSCGYCHNASLMGGKKTGLLWSRLEEVCRKFKKEWTDAVCITGGEPTLASGLMELIEFFRGFGFKIKIDSNGSRPEILKECLPRIDSIAMDIKADFSGYSQLTGFTHTEKIAESVHLIMSSDVDYEFRTTLIESFHTDEQMRGIGELIQGARRYCIQPFIPQDTLPDPRMRQLKRTTPQRLREVEKLMKPFVREVMVRGA
ncbi:MAG: pyruvate formate lyase activating enzyme [Verrucomicrobiota bacterium]|jgi:pyruvate formate lyase activating enzyme|nr:pyruvate formate lyase activating enzyme [Verrucomicrobiota bacterium]MDK2963381.1 pyruvate formate lyase activating enzyme [Verrucomicrobiota bacterium]